MAGGRCGSRSILTMMAPMRGGARPDRPVVVFEEEPVLRHHGGLPQRGVSHDRPVERVAGPGLGLRRRVPLSRRSPLTTRQTSCSREAIGPRHPPNDVPHREGRVPPGGIHEVGTDDPAGWPGSTCM